LITARNAVASADDPLQEGGENMAKKSMPPWLEGKGKKKGRKGKGRKGGMPKGRY